MAEEELKVERRQVREHRSQEAGAWQGRRAEQRRQQEARESQRIAGIKLPHGRKKARDEAWRHKRQRRRQQLAQRKQEDEACRPMSSPIGSV